jgi:hypothetical protein
MKITRCERESKLMLYIKPSKEELADRLVREFRVIKPLKIASGKI